MEFSSSVISIEVNNHVATVWLDRPEKRNAISTELWLDLPRAMSAVAGNDDVRAVIIAGRGDSFCVGIDLQSLTEAPDTSTAEGCLKQLEMTKMCQDFLE